MAQSNSSPSRPAIPQPVQSAAEAEQLISHFGGVMVSLLSILDEETQLVRDGRISELPRIEPKKAELARRYMADAAVVKTNGAYLARKLPREFDTLRRQHGDFHKLLQTNLTVLATAHAVSEGIIRGVAGYLARMAAPQTYGKTGRTAAPGARVAQPISLSRTI